MRRSETCSICASPLTGRQKLYCSTACGAVALMGSDAYRRAQAKRNAAPRKTIERTCQHCGKSWMLDAHSKSRFCSISCAKTAEPSGPRPRRVRTLVYVGPADPVCWLPPMHPVMRTRVRLSRRTFVGVKCVWCDTAFVVIGQLTARYCSKRCTRHADRASRGRFAIRPSERRAIYDRDDWLCQLCMEPVDRDLASTNPFHDWAPSLDHVIPQSKGGTHDASNLRLAHRWCNAVRGAEDYHADLFAAA